jgi:alpha-galactosidase
MPVYQTSQGWVLETRDTAYALGVNSDGMVVHRYWGERLPYAADYPPPPESKGWASFNAPAQVLRAEYPVWGGAAYIEPCLKTTFSDGVRDTVLRYQDDAIDGELLTLHLTDAHYPLAVSLHYRVHAGTNLIERWVTLTNNGDVPITLNRVWSGQWHTPHGDRYRFSYLSGRWNDEWHIRRETLSQGVKAIESRRIATGHDHAPWFALDRGSADETQGEVWFGALAWSGNFKLAAEVTAYASTRVSLGINDWDFAWSLQPGETFTAPSCFGGYTRDGFGAASRALHDHIRDSVLPHGTTEHKVLYNSWEATFFDVDEPSQTELAALAAEMGIELFVVDDGWFHGRNSDNAGLGDWRPDARKFPHGLAPLIEKVNALGMDFGLWIEPEMVNPDSDLYRTHPDWVLHFPTRDRTEMRNQLILNLARTDVQDYLIATLDALLRDHSIAFIKWDMNRSASEPGWAEAGDRQQEIWVRYVQGVYRVWGTLRERHPHVFWQSCSGGGGRADLGILRFADQIWVSDNTDAPARIHIQHGFSHIFPASTMEAWVTDSGARWLPLEFKFHVSMCGSLGVGGHLPRWSPSERAEAARLIALYKRIRPIVQFGDQYRLITPEQGAYTAVQYMSKDGAQGVVFAFRTHMPHPATVPTLYLQGLDADSRYVIEGFDEARSGAAWMRAGLRIELGDFSSAVRTIRCIDGE